MAKKPSPAREYDLYLPLRYNDGREVEPAKVAALKNRLTDRFGGLTFFPQKSEGTWKVGGVTFRDELVILRVLAAQGERARKFFAALKEELKADLEQEDILIVEREVLGPCECPTPAAPEASAMYERFTGQARRVLLLAHREAHRFGHDYLGTEHLLLGVLQEGSGRVAALLSGLSVAAERIRLELEKSVRRGPEVVVGARLPLTPPARRALEFARAEATRLHHDRVGPEQLLLGVLHEADGEATQVLLELGLDLDRLRAAILELPPPEDRDSMLQPAGAPGVALAPDPSAGELEWLVAQDASPTQIPIVPTKLPAAESPLSNPVVAGLALQLKITQLVLGALAGGVAGALLGGRMGTVLGLVGGLLVASVRRTTLGVVVGLAVGSLLAARRAPFSPGLQVLAILAGGLIGSCFGDFLVGFTRTRPPEEFGPVPQQPHEEDHIAEDTKRR